MWPQTPTPLPLTLQGQPARRAVPEPRRRRVPRALPHVPRPGQLHRDRLAVRVAGRRAPGGRVPPPRRRPVARGRRRRRRRRRRGPRVGRARARRRPPGGRGRGAAHVGGAAAARVRHAGQLPRVLRQLRRPAGGEAVRARGQGRQADGGAAEARRDAHAGAPPGWATFFLFRQRRHLVSSASPTRPTHARQTLGLQPPLPASPSRAAQVAEMQVVAAAKAQVVAQAKADCEELLVAIVQARGAGGQGKGAKPRDPACPKGGCGPPPPGPCPPLTPPPQTSRPHPLGQARRRRAGEGRQRGGHQDRARGRGGQRHSAAGARAQAHVRARLAAKKAPTICFLDGPHLPSWGTLPTKPRPAPPGRQVSTELERALPALREAEEALNVLTKKDISELKVGAGGWGELKVGAGGWGACACEGRRSEGAARVGAG
jgi:hypothetical protein